MLFERGQYFLEMGEALTSRYSREELDKNLNLRLCIGYAIFQSVELTLKQICEDLRVDYPNKHYLAPIIKSISKKINNSSEVSLSDSVELKYICRELLENVRLYGDLSYGARYVPDLRFNLNEMDQLFNQAYRLRNWYQRWMS